jgi:hypothetical protein
MRSAPPPHPWQIAVRSSLRDQALLEFGSRSAVGERLLGIVDLGQVGYRPDERCQGIPLSQELALKFSAVGRA